MRLVAEFGKENLATVYVAALEDASRRTGEDASRGAGEDASRLVEFVESVQPPISREEKWVLIVSTLLGCPVGCSFCDAGGWYDGKLSEEEIVNQILWMVDRRYPDRVVPVSKLKIQFARMGEPAFNRAVPAALDRIRSLLDAPGLLPSVSTVAPAGTEPFFEDLLRVKDEHYRGGRFQLQFSIHSTDRAVRERLVPVRGLSFEWMAAYGSRFRDPGDQKVTLNFALAEGVPVDPAVARSLFSPDDFLIKLTPVNPTVKARASRLASRIDPARPETGRAAARDFERAGFDVIVSVGEVEENAIGSNCGMFVSDLRAEGGRVREGYSSLLYSKSGS